MRDMRRRRWTARAVRKLIAESSLAAPRYELVGGELLVTPSPNRNHQLVVKHLELALHAYLAPLGIGEVLDSPFDVELEDESLTQPDLFVLPMDEFRRLADPAAMPARRLMLAVEVLSPSSARYDRETKRPLYQRRVPEYWIVDVDARIVERWRTGDERPEVIADALTWHPAGAAEPFVLGLRDLFAPLDA